MRYLIMAIVYALLANPIGVSAQSTPLPTPQAIRGVEASSNKECQKSELAIMGKKGDKDFLYKLGDSLRIKATGGCFTSIKNALEKTEASKALRLYLDDVSMSSLPVSVSQVPGEKELILTFDLTRRSNEDDNRKAWDTLLGKQDEGHGVMTMSTALTVGNDLAWSVQSVSPFQLYIAKKEEVFGTLAICLAIFLGAYYLLVKNPTALRDGKGGYYSLGKSQMAFWGLLVALTFVGIWLLTGTMEQIPSQVLALLGISGATGLSAIVIGENKKSVKESEFQTGIIKLREEQQRLERERLTADGAFPQVSEARLVEIKLNIDELSRQPASVQSAGFWKDICDDGSGLSFHRLQVVIWTVVLGVVFIGSVTRVMSMPEFSDTLLILLGISNGTYLGFKFPEKS